MRERDGAVLALELFAAGAAHHGKGIAAAVEQNQRLLAALERRLGLLDERPRKELRPGRTPGTRGACRSSSTSGSGRFITRSRSSMRVYLPRSAFCQLSSDGVAEPMHHHRAGQLGAHHGHVARVVARRLFLLVALVVLLVDENQSQIRRGRKDRRARADDNGRVAAADAPPLLAALLGRERGVQQRDFLPEGLIEQAGHLRREADLGNEQDRREAAVESLLHGGEIDGGFSRTRHAIKQERMECPERAGDAWPAHRFALRSG